jgi:hypothetical protein
MRPEEARMGVHCHLCGATLRRPEQFRRLVRPDERDAVYVCRDEDRCDARMAFDPVTGRSLLHDPRRVGEMTGRGRAQK